jgi:membrane protease YdiL (CAAX protease family)
MSSFLSWATLPVLLRAIIVGVLVALIAANVWPALLLSFSVPLAATFELLFLGVYIWWARGGGPPRGTRVARGVAFRSGGLSRTQWFWGLLGGLSFAVTIHAAIVLLFRFTPFPIEAFRHGYDFSFIPSQPLKWIAVVVSATSAGICEETGFRGYMQQPIEQRHGAPTAILMSSFLFMLVHLTKAWAMVGMVPIVFGAGVLLGLLAWSSRSLIPSMVGHVAMDIGLFAYWWTGIAGDFTARPISETSIDRPFLIACAALVTSLLILLRSVQQLRRIGAPIAVRDRSGNGDIRN